MTRRAIQIVRLTSSNIVLFTWSFLSVLATSRGDAVAQVTAEQSPQPSQGSDLPPAVDMLQHYQSRCKKEILALAQQLDQLNAELEQFFVNRSGPRVLTQVDAAWKRGPDARRLFIELLSVPKKYTGWANAAELPGWFHTPESLLDDALRDKRWEAIRPLLTPAFRQFTSLGWDDPQRDSQPWQTADGRTYEWFLLLKWLGDPPPDAKDFDLTWVARQVGADYVKEWRNLPGETRWFFHGEYWYHVLAKPNPANLSFRAAAIASRSCWQVRPPASRDLFGFVVQKDAVLVDLLELIVAERGREPVAVDWFATAARFYPFLTALQPERNGNGVVALRARDESSSELIRLVNEFQARCDDPAVRSAVTYSLYWYQVRAMPLDGPWQHPVAGWSTWTPQLADAAARATRKAEAQVPDTPARPRQSFADETNDALQVGSERAWREICLRMGRDLAKHPAIQHADSLDVAVDHACGMWRLAFGVEELKEVLAEVPELKNKVKAGDAGATPRASPVRCEVKVVAVEPDRGVTVEVRVDGVPVTDGETSMPFAVRGPWPAWFAARVFPELNWQLVIRVIVLFLVVALTVRSCRRIAYRWQRWVMVSAYAFWVVFFLLVVCQAPAPRPVGQIGGTIEFVVAADKSISSPLQQISAESCLAMFRELVASTRGEQPYEDGLAWYRRYWRDLCTICTPAWLPRRDAPSSHHAGSRLAETEYRLVAGAWGRTVLVGGGRLRASEEDAFRRHLASISYTGEPDLPDALRFGPSAGTTYVVNMVHGDHGALSEPADPLIPPRVPVFTLMPMDPTRDGNAARRLSVPARVQWLKDRSTELTCLTPDGLLGPLYVHHEMSDWKRRADASGGMAQDLDALRTNWWSALANDSKKLADTTEDFARRAFEHFQSQRGATSRTVLRVAPEPWQVLMLLGATALFAALPLCLVRPESSSPLPFVSTLGRLLVTVVLVVLFLPAVQAVDDDVRPYGVSLLSALRPVAWWCALGAAAGATMALGGCVIALCQPAGTYAGFVMRAITFLRVASELLRRMRNVRQIVGGIKDLLGLTFLASAIAWVLACPVRVHTASGFWLAWLPTNYGQSVCLAFLLAWVAGLLLWSEVPRWRHLLHVRPGVRLPRRRVSILPASPPRRLQGVHDVSFPR